MQLTELVAVAQRNDVRQRLQHVAEAFRPDPQPMTARSAQGFEAPAFSDQLPAPAIELAFAVGFQRLAAPIALPAPKPWPTLDRARDRFDQVVTPLGIQAASQPATGPHLTSLEAQVDP